MSSLVEMLVDSAPFQNTIVLLIVANTGVMMLERYPMDPYTAQVLENANLLLTLAFTSEMVLKLVAYGLCRYLADSFNRFDGVIVLLSLMDLIVAHYEVDIGVNTSVLRAMRLLRVFKLMRSWTSLRKIVEGMLNSVGQLTNLFVLLLLVIFIFALLGMSLFGDKFTEERGFAEPPRTNFDSIVDSMLTVFVVISGENWNDVWADTASAVGPWCGVYFVLLVTIGNYVVLNLFVAILLGGFQQNHDEDDDDHDAQAEAEAQAEAQAEAEAEAEASEGGGYDRLGHPLPAGVNVHSPGIDSAAVDDASDYALLCLSPANPIRRLAHTIITFHAPSTPALSFDNLIVVVILTSCIAMSLESCDLPTDAPLRDLLEQINTIATIVFATEMGLKIIAWGLLFTPNGYLRSGWNRLDGAIVTSSLISLLGDVPAFKTLRLLRVLRPLRLIARFGSLRVVVDLFIRTLPQVFNVMTVVLLFAIVFAILGVQIFAGKFASCASDDANVARAPDSGACIEAGGVWANPSIGSFDDIGAALLLLFESATMEGWPDVMYAAIDATAQGQAPSQGFAPFQSLFVVAWIILGGMFLLNVFVGVIVDAFAAIKRNDEGLSLMDANQEQWVATMKQLLRLKPTRYPPEPTEATRKFAYRILHMSWFEPAVMGVILFNTALMGLDAYDISPERSEFLSDSNQVCTVIFAVEAAIKIHALSFDEYVREGWNIFDFSVVTISLLESATSFIAEALGINPSLFRAARTVRVLRIIRTVKSAKGLRMLMKTLLLSLPSLYNIAAIFLILLTLYSILGMSLFGKVAHGDFLDDNANFCSFPIAFLTMFRCATGESWNGIMHDAMTTSSEVFSDRPQPRCVDATASSPGDCGSPVAAVLFFMSFQLLATFVILNMMVAIILEEYSKAVSTDHQKISPEDSEAYADAWAHFDPFATGRMHVSHLHAFIEEYSTTYLLTYLLLLTFTYLLTYLRTCVLACLLTY